MYGNAFENLIKGWIVMGVIGGAAVGFMAAKAISPSIPIIRYEQDRPKKPQRVEE